MGRKEKYSFVTKMEIVQRCLSGESNAHYEATLLGTPRATIDAWISLYHSMGENGLITTSKNTVYPPTIKQSAVEDYLSSKGSLLEICRKYQIRSKTQLKSWINKYNGLEKIKSSGVEGKSIMTKGRKTTYEQRIEIVEYCIAHQNNYAKTAEIFQVSYQQVYTWVRKYEANGIDALLDRRGHTKSVDDMSELERLRMENRLLKAQNKRQEMEMNFLKKLDEIERRWD